MPAAQFNFISMSTVSNESDFLETSWAKAYNPKVDPHVYVIACVYLAIVGFLGITLNLFVIILFTKAKQVGLKD
jgi:hypothetical protein